MYALCSTFAIVSQLFLILFSSSSSFHYKVKKSSLPLFVRFSPFPQQPSSLIEEERETSPSLLFLSFSIDHIKQRGKGGNNNNNCVVGGPNTISQQQLMTR